MQSTMPKQYLMLGERTLIQHVLHTFDSHPKISSVRVLISADDIFWQPGWLKACHKCSLHLCGGATRAETVLNGLNVLQQIAQPDDWILVHDAARPGLTHAMIDRLIEKVGQDAQGGILALPVADTLKREDEHHHIVETIPRALLWQAQTPQMFHYQDLLAALTQYLLRAPTDEAQVMEWAGYRPRLVLGGLRNLKVTYPEDLQVLNALMDADFEDNT